MKTATHRNKAEDGFVVFKQLGEQFLKAKTSNPATLAIRSKALSLLQDYLRAQSRIRLQDVTAIDLECWRAEMKKLGFAATSLEVYGRTVRQFFNWLQEQQQLFTNPAAGFTVPRPTRSADPPLSPEQFLCLVAQPDVKTPGGLRDRAVFETLYATGLTSWELVRLCCEDFRDGRVLVHGRTNRSVPLEDKPCEWLSRYLSSGRVKLLGQTPTSAMWLSCSGHPLKMPALLQIFRRHSTAAGLVTVSPNSLRRAFAMRSWQSGMTLPRLQNLLGHRSLKTLGQYLRVSTAELRIPSNHAHEIEKAP